MPGNHVILITGAARRIGASMSRYLHAKGFNIIVHYHQSKASAVALCAELNAIRQASAVAIKADLSKLNAITTLISQSVKAWGRLDGLINNASGFKSAALGDITEKNYTELMDINLKAPLFLAQAAAPYLAKRKGCIINIADIHGHRPMRDYPVYSVSKAGLLMLTQALARELSPAIRVNSISPGPTVWPEGQNTLSTRLKTKIIDRTLLKQHGDPEVIAKTAYFIIAEATSMTGQDIALDGGRSVLI